MDSNKKDKLISLKFVTFIVVFIIGAVYYITIPVSNKNSSKIKTFEEQLEVSRNSSSTGGINTDLEEYTIPAPPKYAGYNYADDSVNTEKMVQKNVGFDGLLNEFKDYPVNSIHFIELIVDKIVVYLGYPSGSVKVFSNNLDKGTGKVQGSYMAAYFDIASGCIYVDSSVLYSLNPKILISIIFHELDHFDKMAKIAKSMGYSEFINLLESKNIKGVNKDFWKKVAYYADVSNFDAKYYQDAFNRLISQHELELTSSYSDFYKLSENMRNPLEISAYGVSDYVESYYNITKTEGPMHVLTRKFNEVDWAVYNFISSDKNIKTERIALFDFFFMQAVVNKFPDLNSILDECITQKNGDLTDFWLNYEKRLADFYLRGRQLNNFSYNLIIDLLNKTLEYAKQGATSQDVANALKYKANTIIKNIVYPNAIKNIKMTSEDYLKFIKDCIENELYSDNAKSYTLPSLKFPELITTLYPPVKKRNKYYFIYDNSAFKKQFETAKQKDNSLTVEKYLKQIIEEHRLVININP